MNELRAENERLKTDRSDSTTSEQSTNYAQGTQMATPPQALVTNTPTTKDAIRDEMKSLETLFYSL